MTLLLSTHAFAVPFDGKDWAQPRDFLGFTWHDISSVCPIGGGECSGSLGTVSFDGWTWASVFEIGSLFHSIETRFPDNGISDLVVREVSALEAVFFGTDGFLPTFGAKDGPDPRIVGWSATVYEGDPSRTQAYAPIVSDALCCVPFEGVWTTAHFRRQVEDAAEVGVWLYRSASIPEPSTLFLVSAGLLAIRARVRASKNGNGHLPVCLGD